MSYYCSNWHVPIFKNARIVHHKNEKIPTILEISHSRLFLDCTFCTLYKKIISLTSVIIKNTLINVQWYYDHNLAFRVELPKSVKKSVAYYRPVPTSHPVEIPLIFVHRAIFLLLECGYDGLHNFAPLPVSIFFCLKLELYSTIAISNSTLPKIISARLMPTHASDFSSATEFCDSQ